MFWFLVPTVMIFYAFLTFLVASLVRIWNFEKTEEGYNNRVCIFLLSGKQEKDYRKNCLVLFVVKKMPFFRILIFVISRYLIPYRALYICRITVLPDKCVLRLFCVPELLRRFYRDGAKAFRLSAIRLLEPTIAWKNRTCAPGRR